MPKISEKNMTDAVVRSLKPQDQRYDVYDANLRGLGVRVSPTGTKSWFVMRRVSGRMTRKTFGRYPELGLSEARKAAAPVLASMSNGITPAHPEKTRFVEIFEEWMSKDQAGNRTGGQARSALQLHVLPKLSNRSIDAIRKSDMHSILDDLVQQGKGTQANRVLSYLRRMFNWCVERDYLESNPTRGMRKPYVEKSRDRVLSLSELGAVLAGARQLAYPFGPLIKLLILTGQRREEVGSAVWDEFDLRSSTWTIPADRAKNGQKHVVHLSKQAVLLLESLPHLEGQSHLFSTTGIRPSSGFSAAKNRLDKLTGTSDWKLHDLRRSFATHATERLDVSPVVVDRILNHQSGAVRGVAAVYQRAEYLEARRTALNDWGEFCASLEGAGEEGDDHAG